MNKILSFILLFIFVINPYADGKLYSINSIYENYAVQMDQRGQNAVIDYQNGIEELYISINANIEKSEELLWIFPVKANEKDVKIEILDKFPKFSGIKIEKFDKSFFKDIATDLLSTDSILNFSFFSGIMLPRFSTAGSSLSAFNTSREPDIQTTSINKYGIELFYSSIISEEMFESLIRKTGKSFNKKELENFREYFSDNYTIITVHIKDIQKFREKFQKSIFTPALKIDFPSKNIYYPMKATMTYKKFFKINILILGNIEPLVKIRELYYDKYKKKSAKNIENNVRDSFFTIFYLYEWNNSEKQDLYFERQENSKLWPKYILTRLITNFIFYFFLLCSVLLFINTLIFIVSIKLNGMSIKENWKKAFFILFTILGAMYIFDQLKPERKSFYRMFNENRKKIFERILAFLVVYVILSLILSFIIGKDNVMNELFLGFFFIFLFISVNFIKLDLFLSNRIFRTYMIFRTLFVIIFFYFLHNFM